MPPTRIVADGLWRALCPSFDVIAFSKVRTPLQTVVRRTKTKSQSSRARTGTSTQSRRFNSTYTTVAPAIEPFKSAEDIKWDPLGTPASLKRQRPKPNLQIDFDTATIEELHNHLRDIRDAQGAYTQIVDLVQHLIEVRGEKPSLRHFDALIRANADTEQGSAEVVEELIKEMDKEGVIGDSGLYHGVMMTLAVHPNHILRAEILEEMRERWISLSPLGHTHLIISHLRDREYELALQVYEGMQSRSIPIPAWLYDVMIYVFTEAGEHATALQLLQQIAERPESNPLDHSSTEDIGKGVWPYFLDSAAAAYEYDSVFYVWGKKVEIGYVRPSDGTLMNVLNTAAQAGDSELATSALKMLAERGGKLEVGAYEALLESYCGNGDVANAMRVLGIMDRAAMGEGMAGVGKPDSASTRPLYMLLKDAGSEAIQSAWECLRQLQEEGGEVPVAAVNVCIEAAEMSGDLELALSFYAELKEGVEAAEEERRLQSQKRKKKKIRWGKKDREEAQTRADSQAEVDAAFANITRLSTPPDATTINLLLQGCGKGFSTGTFAPYVLKEKAMFLAAEMVEQGLRATALTYDRLILVCLGQEDYEDALNYLKEMEALGWRDKLRGGTWNALVRRLAREGDERVEELLEQMKEDGLPTGLLRRKVQFEWNRGWEMTWEEKAPALRKPQQPAAVPETELDDTEAEDSESIQQQLDAMFSAEDIQSSDEEQQSKLVQFVKQRLVQPVPQPEVKLSAPVQQASRSRAGGFAPKFGPLARR